MTLEALGWSMRRQKEFVAHAADGLLPGPSGRRASKPLSGRH